MPFLSISSRQSLVAGTTAPYSKEKKSTRWYPFSSYSIWAIVSHLPIRPPAQRKRIRVGLETELAVYHGEELEVHVYTNNFLTVESFSKFF